MEESKDVIKFVCVSDTHGLHQNIQVPNGDVLIHAGDFSNSGEIRDVKSFNDWLGALPHPIKIVIAGNHDLTFDTENYMKKLAQRFHLTKINDQEVKATLKNCIYLENSSTTVHGYKIYGSPVTPEFCGWAFMYKEPEELAEIWGKIPDDTEILITHGPPYSNRNCSFKKIDIRDKCVSGDRAGCQELLKRVKQVKPLYHIFGHIHETYGVEKIDDTTFINASTCTYRYKPTNQPIVFELPVKNSKTNN